MELLFQCTVCSRIHLFKVLYLKVLKYSCKLDNFGFKALFHLVYVSLFSQIHMAESDNVHVSVAGYFGFFLAHLLKERDSSVAT